MEKLPETSNPQDRDLSSELPRYVRLLSLLGRMKREVSKVVAIVLIPAKFLQVGELQCAGRDVWGC